MKKLFSNLPEVFFMGVGIYWTLENYFSGGHINYISLLVTWLMFIQIIYKNKVLGLVYGLALGVLSLFMMGAVVSEFGEFSAISAQSVQLLSIGGGMFATGAVMSGLMVYKSLTAKESYDESVLTVTY